MKHQHGYCVSMRIQSVVSNLQRSLCPSANVESKHELQQPKPTSELKPSQSNARILSREVKF